MEKKQYELCLEVLRRFHKFGILDSFILIGSWSVYFYKGYFSGQPHIGSLTIKTRDIDFLIDSPSKIKKKINIPEVLKDLGFVTIFRGSQGYIKLDHPELILEFLVPEKGKGIDKPYSLPNLGMNAVTLRFLSFLSSRTIKVKLEDFYITLPHPVNFALHKLIIFQRRPRKEKALKDLNTAVEIIKALIDKGELSVVKRTFHLMPEKWQRKVRKGLEWAKEKDILEMIADERS